MTSRILSEREVEQLASWPGEVARSDLAAFFTLSIEDLRWLRSFRSPRAAADRLGLGLRVATDPERTLSPAGRASAGRIGGLPRDRACGFAGCSLP